MLGFLKSHFPSGYNVLNLEPAAINSSFKIPCNDAINWFLEPPKLILCNCLKISPSDSLGLSGSSIFAKT